MIAAAPLPRVLFITGGTPALRQDIALSVIAAENVTADRVIMRVPATSLARASRELHRAPAGYEPAVVLLLEIGTALAPDQIAGFNAILADGLSAERTTIVTSATAPAEVLSAAKADTGRLRDVAQAYDCDFGAWSPLRDVITQ